ncbi:hypothetical protein HNS38_11810 [Lentimicrobium sp. L6]|uniref:TolB family protein n=1 Tax=Lentimicrobium sp. L6 TaxID=2735916 RepID=UPI001557F498|nr:PD40 domain-containing protein [Lentimicrobium sp. L6]NPD85452.1 hypothetical protein [Lentimicrobium sp. L6]
MKQTMKLKVLSMLLFALIIEVSNAQSSDRLYFNQKPPGNIPEIFAPGIISTEEFEFSGTFSKDGTVYFFTRRPTYEGSQNRIFYSQLIDGKWSEPNLAPFAKDVFEFEPVMSPYEDKIFFYSERKENRNNQYDGDLWFTEKTPSAWSEPQYFLSPANKKWCMSVCPTNSRTLYFSSNYDGVRGIYKAECINGEYPDVKYLEGEINSSFYSHPYVAPDESYMIMDAQPSGRGKPELFISFKNDDDSWGKPINMGAEINATKTEFGASVSPDGKYLFFHRRVDGKGDIYWVDSQIIQLLKQKASIN